MSEYNRNNLFSPCDELECYEQEDGPECRFCEFALANDKIEKLTSDNSGYTAPPKLPSLDDVFSHSIFVYETHNAETVKKTYDVIKKLGNFA